MAIIKPGPLVSEVRGKIGGVVFARNKGGLYVRNFAAPTQGQFEAREEAKSAFGFLSNTWGGLTQSQRDGWTAYGQAVPTVNSLGEEQTISGLAAFMRGNAILRRLGVSLALDPPDAGVRGPTLGQPVLTWGVGLDSVTILGSSADPYGSSQEAYLVAQLSPAVTTARESPSGLPMRFVAWEEIDTNGPFNAGAEMSPLVDAVLPLQTYWLRIRLVTVDGRLGPDRYLRTTTPAAE